MHHSSSSGPCLGAWRDGKYLVCVPARHQLPNVCIMTGVPLSEPPRPLAVRYFSWQRFWMSLPLVPLSFLLAWGVAVILLRSGITDRAIVGAAFGGLVSLGFLGMRAMQPKLTWTIHAPISLKRKKMSFLGLLFHFLLSPIMVVVTLGYVFQLQAAVVNKPAAETTQKTFLALGVAVVFLGMFFWGLLRKGDEKPRVPRLQAYRHENGRIWLRAHPRFLARLPGYRAAAGTAYAPKQVW